MGWSRLAGPGETHAGHSARRAKPCPGLDAVALGAQCPASAPGGCLPVDPAAPQPSGARHLRGGKRPQRCVPFWSKPWCEPRARLRRGRIFRGLRWTGLVHDHRRRLTAGGNLLHVERGLGHRARRGEPGRRPRRNAGSHRGGLHPVAHPCGADLPGHRSQLRPDDPGRADRDRGHDRRPRRGVEAGMSVRAVSTVRLVQEHSILVLIGLLVALTGLIEIIRPGAVNASGVSNILEFAAPLGILAAGQTLVVITGGIDLSVANVATAAAYIMASQAPYGVTRGIVLGLLVGVAVGLVNGVGVAVFRVQPLIMTLAMGLVVTGSLNVYSQAAIRSVPGVPAVIHTLGSGTVLEYVPVSLFLWALLAAVLIIGLRGTGFGRLLYAVGDNLEATRLAGVRGWQVLLANYAACGFLSAVAGLVLAGTVNAADLSLANILLLPSVAAVVIGGTSIFGGSGSYTGTAVGALILTVLNSVLTLLDVPDAVKQVLYGAIIVLLAAAYTRVLGRD